MKRIVRIPKVTLTVLVVAGICLLVGFDHADPIDPLNFERLEGGITDLFAFPLTQQGTPAIPFQGNRSISLSDPFTDNVRPATTSEQRQQIDSLVFILCVRRALTSRGNLTLAPYSFRIHLDMTSKFYASAAENQDSQTAVAEIDDHDHLPTPGYSAAQTSDGQRPTVAESVLSYGGKIADPARIREDVIIEFQMNDDALLKEGSPQFTNLEDQAPHVVLKNLENAPLNRRSQQEALRRGYQGGVTPKIVRRIPRPVRPIHPIVRIPPPDRSP
jgi:hypothetical protein